MPSSLPPKNGVRHSKALSRMESRKGLRSFVSSKSSTSVISASLTAKFLKAITPRKSSVFPLRYPVLRFPSALHYVCTVPQPLLKIGAFNYKPKQCRGRSSSGFENVKCSISSKKTLSTAFANFRTKFHFFSFLKFYQVQSFVSKAAAKLSCNISSLKIR